MFDVGAKVGEWAEAACLTFPRARVHALEINSFLAAPLLARLAPFGERAVVHAFGLGDRAGTVEIFVDPTDSTRTSVLPFTSHNEPSQAGPRACERHKAEIATGDGVLAEAGIDNVDLLKIDVEGSEGAVLDGFAQALAAAKVRIIQFDYGRVNLRTGTTLKWFYDRLVPLGFRIGKLYPEGVAFKEYSDDDEDVLGPNCVACHTGWPEAIEALRCPPLSWRPTV